MNRNAISAFLRRPQVVAFGATYSGSLLMCACWMMLFLQGGTTLFPWSNLVITILFLVSVGVALKTRWYGLIYGWIPISFLIGAYSPVLMSDREALPKGDVNLAILSMWVIALAMYVGNLVPMGVLSFILKAMHPGNKLQYYFSACTGGILSMLVMALISFLVGCGIILLFQPLLCNYYEAICHL